MAVLKPNQFEVTVSAGLEGLNRQNIFRWINTQHDGRELIPLDEKCSKKHQDAAWNAVKYRIFVLTIEVNKNGSWKLIKTRPA